MRIPLAGNIRTRDGTSNKNSRLTNALVEEKKNGVTLTAVRPGLNTVVTGSGSGNNIVCFNDNLVNIFGTDIKRVTSSGGISLNDPNAGTMVRVVGGQGTVSIAYLDQVVITKGTARYTNSYSLECLTSGTDTLDANVVMRLRFEGADGSTTITDDKGHSITNSGSNHIKTDQFACGASSVKMDGSNYLTFGYSADFDLGTGDFCIEFRIRFYNMGIIDYEADINALGIYRTDTPYGGWRFALGTDADLEQVTGIYFIRHGISTLISGSTGALSADTWYSFAVSRESGIMRLFMDGDLLNEVDTNTYSLTSIGTMGAGFYDTALMP